MDKREARFYISANPGSYERRGSFLGGIFSRRRLSSTSSTSSDDGTSNPFTAYMQRRGSMDPPEVTSLAQKVQQEMKRPGESSIFT